MSFNQELADAVTHRKNEAHINSTNQKGEPSRRAILRIPDSARTGSRAREGLRLLREAPEQDLCAREGRERDLCPMPLLMPSISLLYTEHYSYSIFPY